MSARFWQPLAAVVFVVLALAPPVCAEDSLDAARELYAAAAYDDALAMLNRLHGTSDAAAPELEQERALCLLALNQVPDAERAIAVVVQANPLYLPDASTVAPRVRAAFHDVRARLLPDLARSTYARARASFTQKEYARALADLDVVLALTTNLPEAARDKESLHDIRMLAEGFKQLTEAALAPPPAPPAAAVVPEEAASVERIFDATVPGVQQPAIIKQDVPAWRPSMGTPPGIAGLLSVTIDSRGLVERAEMIRPLNPTFDSQLLAATEKWSYVPAMHEGVRVKFRKIIRLELR
jgi:tetratricopeptide (TPR) repeat protein